MLLGSILRDDLGKRWINVGLCKKAEMVMNAGQVSRSYAKPDLRSWCKAELCVYEAEGHVYFPQ